MSTQNMEQAMEHLVTFQGAEIRKFILTELSKLAKIEKLDVDALNASVATVSKILESNKQGLTLVTGLVEGNKLEIGKAKEELKTLIAKLIQENKDSLLDVISKTNNTTLESVKALESKVDTQIKDLAKNQEIDTRALCDGFSKSLWNYQNYVCIENTILQAVSVDEATKGNVSKLYLKVSGDHFNPKSSGFDVSEQGSPFIKVIVNGEVVANQQIKAVKMFNQFETFTIACKKITSLEVVFVQDAYEGGTDKNLDGISEDRNLYVFEATINDVDVRSKLMTKIANKTSAFQECLYSQCSLFLVS